MAFSHHNCIYKATRPPAWVLELLLSWLKHSSLVIKYVLEESDKVLTHSMEKEQAKQTSKCETYRLPQIRQLHCHRTGDTELKSELELWLRGMAQGFPLAQTSTTDGMHCIWWPAMKVSWYPLTPNTNNLGEYICYYAVKMILSNLSPLPPPTTTVSFSSEGRKLCWGEGGVGFIFSRKIKTKHWLSSELNHIFSVAH